MWCNSCILCFYFFRDTPVVIPSRVDYKNNVELQKRFEHRLKIPRRPKKDLWSSAEELTKLENEAFLKWRSDLSELQEVICLFKTLRMFYKLLMLKFTEVIKLSDYILAWRSCTDSFRKKPRHVERTLASSWTQRCCCAGIFFFPIYSLRVYQRSAQLSLLRCCFLRQIPLKYSCFNDKLVILIQFLSVLAIFVIFPNLLVHNRFLMYW